MKKHIDQSEISRRIAQEKKIDQAVVDAFIKELFKGIESKIKENTSIKVEGLGLFRVIRSGDNRRILFLGNVTNLTEQPETTKLSPSTQSPLINEPELFIDSEPVLELTDLATEPTTEKTFVAPAPNSAEQEATAADKRAMQTDVLRNRLRELENRPLYANANRPEQAVPNKSKKPIYVGLAVLALLIVGTFAYKLISPSSDNNEWGDETFLTDRVSHFAEVANNYPNTFSCVILLDQDISLKELSRLYYGTELFWPYIYEANKSVIQNNLTVSKDNLVRIPKVTVDLVRYSSGALEGKLREKGEKVEKKLREAEK